MIRPGWARPSCRPSPGRRQQSTALVGHQRHAQVRPVPVGGLTVLVVGRLRRGQECATASGKVVPGVGVCRPVSDPACSPALVVPAGRRRQQRHLRAQVVGSLCLVADRPAPWASDTVGVLRVGDDEHRNLPWAAPVGRERHPRPRRTPGGEVPENGSGVPAEHRLTRLPTHHGQGSTSLWASAERSPRTFSITTNRGRSSLIA